MKIIKLLTLAVQFLLVIIVIAIIKHFLNEKYIIKLNDIN